MTIVEKDITDQSVSLLYPVGGIILKVDDVLFGWEEISEATAYRIQIVEPDFNSPNSFLLDSLIEGVNFSFPLDAGTYQWRLRAENSATETDWIVEEFSVLIDDSFAQSQPILNSPNDGLNTSEVDVEFDWEELQGASSFLLRVYEDDNGDAGQIIHESLGVGASEVVTFDEGKYVWHVAAVNSQGTSNFSGLRSFQIDLSSPTSPVLISPGIGEVITALEYTFTWESGIDENWNADSIYVYQTDIALPIFALEQVNQNVTIDLSQNLADGYQYEVVSIDFAGNRTSSGLRQFFLE